MINIDRENCTACGACIQICPVKCICFEEDKYGFRYPVINSKECIDCQQCERVCPIDKKVETVNNICAYAAKDKSTEKCLAGTSGGVFGALAEYVISKKGIVYGCAFDKDLRAKHIRVDDIKALKMLKGSKYVQSDTCNTFVDVKNDLELGKIVLYVGTPCQIAGLKCFLGGLYDNLITVDLICHGVPSQAYFDKYIEGLKKQLNAEISKFDFRSKLNKGWSHSGIYDLKLNGGQLKSKPLYYFDSYYYYFFLEGFISRDCCYTCKYANPNRVGDFSLGDLWGAENLNLKFSVKNGCSLVLANTKKANELLMKLKLDIDKISLDDAIKYNEQLKRPSKKAEKRNIVLDEYINLEYKEIDKNFKKNYRKQIIFSKLKYMVPPYLKLLIQKVRYKYNSQ